MKDPSNHFTALEEALKEVARNIADTLAFPFNSYDQYSVGLVGSFGDHHVNPRSLQSRFIGKMVSLEGIVTKCSLFRPKVSRSVHYCEASKTFMYKEYRDSTKLAMSGSNLGVTGTAYPTTDANNNPLMTEYGLSIYKDHQNISVQEMPERAPPGQLPRSVEVLLDDDLVDQIKPGDRVRIVGVYRSMGAGKNNNAVFRTALITNNISIIGSKSSSSKSIPSTIVLTEDDKKNIKQVAKRGKIFELLSQSLMPSVYGHSYIKKAIALMLLGGVEKNLDNGTHIRGDINVLLVGDPSTAKSQTLRYVLNMANLGVATTGRGSSGVGLTAAVTTDQDTGDRKLEAGAMVLADRGVVCIDEFDKMSDVDRVAIHEVMEQQTVTISKAGIHTTLNARCSVLAASNPIFGQYDETKDPHKNIALPDSLLSRFDLLFIVLDRIEESNDRRISDHVLKMHQYIPPNVNAGAPILETYNSYLGYNDLVEENQNEQNEESTSEVFAKGITSEHAGIPGRGPAVNGVKPRDVLTSSFIKKYIHYAKSEISPILTPEAANAIHGFYSDLRNGAIPDQRRKTLPVTARTLETLIRLSTAHAKSRLSTSVTKKDAEIAYEIMRFAMFQETKTKVKGKRRRVRANGTVIEEDVDSDDSDDDMDTDEAYQGNRNQAQFSSRVTRSTAAQNGHGSGPGNNTQQEPSTSTAQPEPAEDDRMDYELSEARHEEFRKYLILAIGEIGQTIKLDELLSFIEQKSGSKLFSKADAETVLDQMQSENSVMYSNGVIYTDI